MKAKVKKITDKKILLEKATKNINILKQGSDKLRSDKTLILKLIESNGHKALKCCYGTLRRDRDFVIIVLKQCGLALQYLGKDYRDDKELVEFAVNHSGWALKWASDRLKADKELVEVAINNDFMALEHASKELKHIFKNRFKNMF